MGDANVVVGLNDGPTGEHLLIFDCRNHQFKDASGGGVLDAPPRSVAGRILAIACKDFKPPKSECVTSDAQYVVSHLHRRLFDERDK